MLHTIELSLQSCNHKKRQLMDHEDTESGPSLKKVKSMEVKATLPEKMTAMESSATGIIVIKIEVYIIQVL